MIGVEVFWNSGYYIAPDATLGIAQFEVYAFCGIDHLVCMTLPGGILLEIFNT